MLTLLHPEPDTPAGPRCPRCLRPAPAAHCEEADLAILRLIDPHVEAYTHHATPDGGVVLCTRCDAQLDRLYQALDAYRRRLVRHCPTPVGWIALADDRRLAEAFETVRDTALRDVATAARVLVEMGQTPYLLVTATGTWSVQAGPCVAGDQLAIPVPLATDGAVRAQDLATAFYQALYSAAPAAAQNYRHST